MNMKHLFQKSSGKTFTSIIQIKTLALELPIICKKKKHCLDVGTYIYLHFTFTLGMTYVMCPLHTFCGTRGWTLNSVYSMYEYMYISIYYIHKRTTLTRRFASRLRPVICSTLICDWKIFRLARTSPLMRQLSIRCHNTNAEINTKTITNL